MKYTVDVDTKTFVRFWLVIFTIVAIGFLIWQARFGLMLVGIAIFLAIAIQPLAAHIQRFTGRKNSSFASVMAYTIIILAIALILAVVAPVVADETIRFVRQFPETFESTIGGWDGINSFGHTIGVDNLQDQIVTALQSFSNSVVSNFSNLLVTGIGTISGIVTSIILTLVLTLLFAIEGPGLMHSFWKLLEGKSKNSTVSAYRRLSDRIAGVISSYVSKQVIVALLDGCVVTATILLLSLIFGFSGSIAVPMGLLALVFYLIPMFGQIISAILISLIVLFSSPAAAIIFLIFYTIYAQVENNFIAPKLQGDAQGLPTAVILSAIVIGIYAFGLLGAIIAIPVAGCIKVILEEIPALRKVHNS